MKKTFKLFTLILFAFLFTNVVNAGVSDAECNIRLRESGINSAGFNVVMPICGKKTRSGYWTVGTYGSFGAANAAGDKEIDTIYSYESADGKDFHTANGKVPVCRDPARKVVATSSCTAYRGKATNTVSCGNLDSEDCRNAGCYYNSRNNYCYRYRSYCPSGWTETGNGGSTACKQTYAIDKQVYGNINAANECRSNVSGATSCSCSTTSYRLDCPAYVCTPENKEITACTPEFKNGDNDVYCVNPSQHFGNLYKEDKTFNVRSCANSYVTPDCGYANILIEGAFHKTGDGVTKNDAINLALRLWSYHTDQKGFNKTGIANRGANTCSDPTYFMTEASTGRRPNVYEKTYNYIMRTNKTNYFEVATSIMNENKYLPKYLTEPETNTNPFTGATFSVIDCDTADNGKLGVTCGGNPTYRVAFELFFNTMLGNRYMQEHLNSLYKENGTWVASTGATLSEEEDGVWVVIEYKTEEFEEIFTKGNVIDCKKDKDKYSAEDWAKIEPYCKTIFTYYDEDGNVIEPEDQVVDICIKNTGCKKKTEIKAICSTASGGSKITKVEVKDDIPISGTSVRKLIPCETPDETQYMFEFVPYEDKKEGETTRSESTTYYTNYLCGGGCSNYEARVDENNSCTSEMKESFKSTVSDPSLSCIVNMDNPDQKEYYDYSSEFGVNTNFCRIYCSDKVEYYIAGRTDAESGRDFKYDVKQSKSNVINDKQITSLVKQKRSCVSEIFLNSLNKNTNWKRMYGLTDDENKRLMDNSTFSTLFDIMAHKAEKERGRRENLNQLVYDLYNCNLYALEENDIRTKYNIYKPGDYKKDYASKIVASKFSSDSNYGLGKNNQFSDTVSFEGGANVAEYVNSNDGQVVGKLGQGGYEVKTHSIRNASNEGFGIVKNSKNEFVKYCKTGEDEICLQYDSDKEDYLYGKFKYPSEIENYSTKNMHEYTLNSIHYTYPVNNYALFEVETETGFFNGDKYQTFENTGNIVVNPDSMHDDLLTLDSYVYPLSRFAATECKDAECGVKQTLNISHFFRAKETDPLQTATQNKEFTCSVHTYPTFCTDEDCPKETPLANLYRNVDPSALFPNGVGDDTNWATAEGVKAKEDIEKSANLIQTGDELIDYRITLNPTQIKAIKEYNQKAGIYSNEIIYCDSSNLQKDGTYRNCSSRFMETLRGNNVEYSDGGELGTLDKNYTGTSKYFSKITE